MDWLLLAIFCAFCFATADAMTKKYLQGYRAHELVIIRFTVPGLLLLPVLAMQPLPDLPLEFWGWVACLVPLEILAMLLYVMAIRDTSLALTLPYLAFTPVFNTVTGYLVLGETVSLMGMTGILLVVIGTWLLNLQNTRNGGHFTVLAPFRAILTERGSRYMLIVSVIYSFTSVLGKGALHYTTPFFFGTFYYINLGLAVLILFSLRHPETVSVLWRRPLPHLLVGGFMALMVVSHFYAIQLVEVAYMIAAKRTSLLFGMLYGVILFGEGTTPLQFLAGAVMVSGVILISL
jgi:drug/metabolite transporter (DMT)-like permease